MRITFHALMSLTILFAMCSCKKESTNSFPGNDFSNFSIAATPVVDGTGKVDFVATAPNATDYLFEFGDGTTAKSTSGTVQHQYVKNGTNTYAVTVTANRSSGDKLVKTTNVTVTVSGAAIGLVWADEFDAAGSPSATNWTYDIGTGNNGWGNNEKQYYTNRPDNVTVQGGNLRITAQKENYLGSGYTSARLVSKGRFEFKYGKVEVRAKLPAGGGTWPAIWMLGTDINAVGWPACGEIDIMEHIGNDLNKILATLHYPGRFGGNADGNSVRISNATTEFHIYKLEWTDKKIAMYVDDQLIHTVANSTALPFNKDFFFILNVAMGGNLGGNIDPAFTRGTMEIDYIRVFK